MLAYSALSDDELIINLRKGDERAFTEIYNRYWEKLLAIGYHFTHLKQDAEDIVHEVMIGLWSRKDEINVQSLNAYLGTAVKFAVFKKISRDRIRRELLKKIPTALHSTDTEDKLEARFLEEYLKGVVEHLPQKARLVFTYSRDADLSITEIGGRLDLSPKAVEYHMTKALKSLREALKKIKCLFV